MRKYGLFIATVIAFVAVWVLSAGKKETTSVQTEEAQPVAVAARPKPAVNKYDAYGIACQIVKNKYADAEDFHLIEATDMGGEEWTISGMASVNGRRLRWAAEVKHGSDDLWTQVYPIAFSW